MAIEMATVEMDSITIDKGLLSIDTATIEEISMTSVVKKMTIDKESMSINQGSSHNKYWLRLNDNCH